MVTQTGKQLFIMLILFNAQFSKICFAPPKIAFEEKTLRRAFGHIGHEHEMISELNKMIEIFSLPFIQRAAIAGVLIGFVTSYYGVFIVQRKLSFLGSGLAHSAFGGAALGLLLDTEPLWVALPFTIIISILIVYLKEKSKLSGDTSVGILFSVAVALGIIFLSLKKGYTNDAFTYLLVQFFLFKKLT
jgi:ABC-type Mn2+/Zn2+ transport system permease subunit